ncbi:hypothetical protein [Tautonia rosea]|uniref:hypothetical protein n=1 Tax=Tautonia rosea TaxID=2728037 RepID=UPI00147648C3|nr:hypothetical protein [Tautonia rosea]
MQDRARNEMSRVTPSDAAPAWPPAWLAARMSWESSQSRIGLEAGRRPTDAGRVGVRELPPSEIGGAPAVDDLPAFDGRLAPDFEVVVGRPEPAGRLLGHKTIDAADYLALTKAGEHHNRSLLERGGTHQ